MLNANSAKTYIPKHIPSRGIAGGLVVKSAGMGRVGVDEVHFVRIDSMRVQIINI